MTVQDAQKLARRWWWILILLPVLAGGVAYIVSSAMTPLYQAQSTLVIENQPSTAESFNDIRAAERQAQTYSYLVTVRSVLEETIDRLGLSVSPEALDSKIEVSPIRDTQLMTVTVTDPSPEQAATIANTVAQVFIDQDVVSESGTQIQIAEQAAPPSQFASPRISLNTMLATIVGALLAVGLVALIGYLDDTVKGVDDVRRLTGKAALAAIPSVQQDDGIEVVLDPRSPMTESFRSLRTNLQFAMAGHDIHSLVFTSAQPGEGKTTTVANLGAALAQGGLNVVLVDADLRKPRLHKLFNGLTNRNGLTNLLLAGPDSDLDEYLQATAIPGVNVLTTGPLPPNPPDLLNSPGMHELVERLEDTADIVLIDSPPMAVSDPLILASLVGGISVVSLAGQTRSNTITRIVEDLEPTGTPLVGIIVNQADISGDEYYYYYQSYYQADPDEPGSGGGQPPSQGREHAPVGSKLSSSFSKRPARAEERGN